MIITVCIGSGCHVKGSRRIIEILQTFIVEKQLEAEIVLQACFCQNKCTEGVVIKINDRVFTGVSPENVLNILQHELDGRNKP